MKLKYYLRGMGIGIILTAIVMGFALGGRRATLSDAEIIQRAKVLGMVEGNNGVLTQTQEGAGSSNENDSSTSDQALGQEGSPVFEEIQQEVVITSNPVPEVDEKEEEARSEAREILEASQQASERVEEAHVANARPDDSASDTGRTSEASSERSITESVSSTDSASAERSVQEAREETREEVTREEETREEARADERSDERTDDSASEASTKEETATASTDSKPSGSPKTVTIPGGMSSDQVAQVLYREGIVDDASAFNKYLVEKGMDRVIRSGEKTFPAGASYDQVAGIITKG